jgi:hypothetical protein
MDIQQFQSAAIDLIQKAQPGFPRGILVTEHNSNIIAGALLHFYNTNRRMPSVHETVNLVTSLGDINYGGKLQFNTPAVQAQVEELPFKDDPNLRWLQSIEDYLEASADKIKPFNDAIAHAWQPKLGEKESLNARFNARVSYLKRNNVRRPKVEEVPQAPVKPKSKGQQMYDDLMEKIEAMNKPRGTTMANHVKKQNRLREDARSMAYDQDMGLETITKYIDAKIREYERGEIH